MTEQPGPGESPPLTPYEANRRLREALLRLGVDFGDTLGLVRYDPEVETACWAYSPRTGLDWISVGTSIASLPIPLIEMALRHELLHRAIYHAFNQRFDQPQLTNLVLDICINRLLHEAYPRQMTALSGAIYPPESKTTLIALADCTANPEALPSPAWRTLWYKIWRSSGDKVRSTINPAGLYYRLVQLVRSPEGELNETTLASIGQHSPWARRGNKENPPFGPLQRAIRDSSRTLSGRLPRGSALGRALTEFSAVPLSIGVDPIEDFLCRIQVHRRITEVASRITSPWKRAVQADPYPLFPSRIGFIYQSLGYGDLLHRYWNLHPAPGGAKLTVGFYLDVSASMEGRYGIVAALARELAEFPLTLRVFDLEVRPGNIEDLSAGHIQSLLGTDFDAPILDFIADEALTAGVLFTDGMAEVTAGVAEKFHRSRKDLYVVYLPENDVDVTSSPLNRLARETFTFRFSSSQMQTLLKGTNHGL